MVFEPRGDHASQWAAGVSIAGQFRMTTETLRSWVRPAESMTVADGDDNGEACAGQVARARESGSWDTRMSSSRRRRLSCTGVRPHPPRALRDRLALARRSGDRIGIVSVRLDPQLLVHAPLGLTQPLGGFTGDRRRPADRAAVDPRLPLPAGTVAPETPAPAAGRASAAANNSAQSALNRRNRITFGWRGLAAPCRGAGLSAPRENGRWRHRFVRPVWRPRRSRPAR